MKTKALGIKKLIGNMIGVIIGALVSVLLPHPLLGVLLGVIIVVLSGNYLLWKEGARRGAITGLIIILLAGLVILPPRLASSEKSEFVFYDSLFFYLILGGLGSVVIGGIIGGMVSQIRKILLAKNDIGKDLPPSKNG